VNSEIACGVKDCYLLKFSLLRSPTYPSSRFLCVSQCVSLPCVRAADCGVDGVDTCTICFEEVVHDDILEQLPGDDAYTLLQLFLDTLLGVTGSAAAPRPRRT